MPHIDLRSERLTIKDITSASAEEMFEYRSNTDVSRFLTFSPRNLDDIVSFIDNSNKDFNVENRWFQAGLFNEGTLIGDIGIHFLGPMNLQCEIGCTINPRFQKKGFGREAVSRVIDFLFQDLKKHRVFASLSPENKASIALLESIGLRREGLFLRSVYIHGNWEDDLVFGILDEEWKTRKTANI